MSPPHRNTHLAEDAAPVRIAHSATGRTLPATSASPVANDDGTFAVRIETGVALAEEMEGTRRSITLGGSLFLIPATAAVVVMVAASLGVSGLWLGICGLAGLAIGPGLCLASLAGSNLVGRPIVRTLFVRRAMGMGLKSDEIETAWRRADALLNDQARRRLGAAPVHRKE